MNSPTMPPTMRTPLDLDDIQGNIVRGYNMQHARHFALASGSAAAAARFIGALLGPGEGPRISTAAPWQDKPDYCLNLGITAPGLVMLGLPPATMALFPTAYTEGAAARAAALGDTGPAAPSNWVLGGATAPTPEQLVLSLYTDEHRVAALERISGELRALMARHGITELSHHDAQAFAHGAVHFGYRDGIGQPRIEGGPGRQTPDMQPASSAGEFLLGGGHINQFAGNWLGDLPPELGTNATYGAMRIIEQDVAAFERFIELAAQRYDVDKEWVAAKLMGRWRNGMPLTLAPDSATPPLPETRLNQFDYVPTAENPAYFDDSAGKRCPVGAHIRRLNPRSALVMGKPHTRRIIRRGMPYGPAYTPGQADDGVERGLIGYFLCGDLEMQFEFLLQNWANADYATSGLRGSREPILGAQPPEGGRFVLRTDNALDPIVFDDLPRWTVTRGCLYCLLPGMGGLRFLAQLGGAAPGA
jgi:deferrochelatase/peroxidase EfeB